MLADAEADDPLRNITNIAPGVGVGSPAIGAAGDGGVIAGLLPSAPATPGFEGPGGTPAWSVNIGLRVPLESPRDATLSVSAAVGGPQLGASAEATVRLRDGQTTGNAELHATQGPVTAKAQVGYGSDGHIDAKVAVDVGVGTVAGREVRVGNQLTVNRAADGTVTGGGQPIVNGHGVVDAVHTVRTGLRKLTD